MPELKDAELLRAYADEKSESAFGELVRRHVNLVYSVALRQCGSDAHLAEDVAQRVFTDLARKARSLSGHAVLGGWLYRSTQFAASDVVRGERRRRAREEEAHVMQEISRPDSAAGDADWQKLAPVLDEAIGELAAPDRDAVVLRFFEGRPFAEIGATLRLTDDAARMRVERALDKLRAALGRRGITSTTAALGVALANQTALAAPVGIAASVTGAALAGATVAASGGPGALATFLSMSKIKVGIVGVIIVAGLATVAIEARANRELRAEYHGSQIGNEDLARLQATNQQLNAALKKIGGKNPEVDELARLNGRLAQLKARPEGVVDSVFQPIANVGRSTPQEAYVTFCAALNSGDVDGVARLITFRDDTKEGRDAFMAGFSEIVRAKYRTPERLFAAALFGMQEGVPWPDPAVSFQVLQTYEDHEPGVIRVRLWVHQAGGRESEIRDTFIRTPDGWALIFRPLSDERTAGDIRARIDPLTGQPVPAKK